MAEISKETRDAFFREFSDKEIRAEMARRKHLAHEGDPYEMKVNYSPPIRVEGDVGSVRITMRDDFGRKVVAVLGSSECPELIRRIKTEAGLD